MWGMHATIFQLWWACRPPAMGTSNARSRSPTRTPHALFVLLELFDQFIVDDSNIHVHFFVAHHNDVIFCIVFFVQQQQQQQRRAKEKEAAKMRVCEAATLHVQDEMGELAKR